MLACQPRIHLESCPVVRRAVLLSERLALYEYKDEATAGVYPRIGHALK
jgi:hypothetical protein